MPASNRSRKIRKQRTALLLEAVALLVDELALMAAEEWERLPDLKKQKVEVACRLRQLRAETESADGAPADELEMLISNLEAQSRAQARQRLDVIGNQLVALQELSLYLRESLHVKLHRTTRRLGQLQR